MRLWFNPASPFARKVRIVARETGLAGRIEEINTVVNGGGSCGCRRWAMAYSKRRFSCVSDSRRRPGAGRIPRWHGDVRRSRSARR